MDRPMRWVGGAILLLTGMILGAFALLLIPPKLLAKIMSRLALDRLANVLPGPLGAGLKSSINRTADAAELVGSTAEGAGEAARKVADTVRTGGRDTK